MVSVSTFSLIVDLVYKTLHFYVTINSKGTNVTNNVPTPIP